MMVSSPDDFYWKASESTFEDALHFLVRTRMLVAQLAPPADRPYIQIAHSDDAKAVGGDPNRPAVLDASYEHFGVHRLSISLPDFTPHNEPVAFSMRKMSLKETLTKAIWPDTKINLEKFEVNTGFTYTNLKEALGCVLNHYGIDSDESKIGYSRTEGTQYIETIVPYEDFLKGRKIIQAYVHGTGNTAQRLQSDIENALDNVQTTPKPKNGFPPPSH